MAAADPTLGDFTLWGHDCLLSGAQRAVERITETTVGEPCLSGLVDGVIISVWLCGRRGSPVVRELGSGG